MGQATPFEVPLRKVEGVMACELGDGLALLHHATGKFFVLDEVGSFIWNLLAVAATTDEVAEAVKRTYDAVPEEVDRDIRDFVRNMMEARLFQAQAIEP